MGFQSQQLLSTKKLEPPLWVLINEHFPQTNPDVEFWWRTTGVPLAILLHTAAYSINDQLQNLLFYYQSITPELGVGPNAQGLPRSWKSFMTDHHSPIEFSWEWGRGGEAPIVRLSIEPIGPYAGGLVDPFNQYATTRLIYQYQPLIPDCDVRLFDHFSRELLSYKHVPSQDHSSRTFVAFDFGKDNLMLKAYFLPTFKAVESKQSTWEIITQAIRDLPDYSLSAYPALSTLQSYLTTSPHGSALEAEIFAIDCVAPRRSRLKIYMRSRSTSFDSVRDIMTLGGRLDGSSLNHGLNEVQKLWSLVFPQWQPGSGAEDLRQNNHRTAGVLYYFDIKPETALPGVKIYIPVRHYGQNDLAIADGLAVYLKSQGQGHFARNYMEALEGMAPPSSLRSRCRIQTYIGCSVVGGQLKLTSYLAPEVYQT